MTDWLSGRPVSSVWHLMLGKLFVLFFVALKWVKSDFVLFWGRSVGFVFNFNQWQWDIYEVPNLKQVLTICRPHSLLKGWNKVSFVVFEDQIGIFFQPNYSHKTDIFLIFFYFYFFKRKKRKKADPMFPHFRAGRWGQHKIFWCCLMLLFSGEIMKFGIISLFDHL